MYLHRLCLVSLSVSQLFYPFGNPARLYKLEMIPAIPPFNSLPIDKSGPPYNAWGLYGSEDELGRLHLITPEAVKRGRDTITEGISINLK